MFFRKSYLVEVCFAGGNRPYTYLWQGRVLRPGDVVIVPTGAGTQSARVASVTMITGPISECRVSRVLRMADSVERAKFSSADCLRPAEGNTSEVKHRNFVIAP